MASFCTVRETAIPVEAEKSHDEKNANDGIRKTERPSLCHPERIKLQHVLGSQHKLKKHGYQDEKDLFARHHQER